ncbi:MAG: hypothetical protein Q7U77_02960 [Sediminibacterium sp.]|uniref:hypothetical protein n=1 Tax=Sediminibacterium sp. TaxID=1917865 RepID=UPI0027167033|nr:hypothetical protein [Sediminibacterium sp.]MDO8995560.1 hypothetical protein [Sediminibacterium sp.]
MSTYGQFYNPKEPDNRIKILVSSLAAAILISILFSRCNSVKTATDIKISKLDSSSILKVDSSSNQKNDITFDNNSLKFWDKESVIEFWPWQNAKIGKSSLGNIGLDKLNQAYADQYNNVIINDGFIELINQNIKSITTRSKGKDSSTSKTIDKSEKSADLKKEANTEVKTYNKDKTKNKESKRISPVFIAIGLFAGAVIGFFIAHKFRP